MAKQKCLQLCSEIQQKYEMMAALQAYHSTQKVRKSVMEPKQRAKPRPRHWVPRPRQ